MNEIDLSVVIPTSNEEQRIELSLRKIRDFFSSQQLKYEVIISDDGSTDSTRKIARKNQDGWSELVLLKNSHKGKAPAIISGINNARGEYVLVSDIDLSVPIDEASKMMVWLKEQGYDAAIASREGSGAKRINEPYIRHFMGRIFNLIVQILILPGINDTQCGFKMFKSKAAREIFKKTKLYSPDDPDIKGARLSGFDVELLYVARKLGYKIKEVPVTWTYGDNSKVHSMRDSYYNTRDVIKVRLNSLKGVYK